ncbi:MAG TPA: N-6 DNA methylase [Clostridiales bacterium]|nr:N-6 DNA methylase [Clostridiales bacterium]
MKTHNNIFVTCKEAAELLCISEATVKNWERSGILKREGGLFLREDIVRISYEIQNGVLNRLSSRANKRGAAPEKLPCQDDLNGLSDELYQEFKEPGRRSREGSFYTPESIVNEIISDNIPRKGKLSVYDPCCGTGRFLIAAFHKSSGRAVIKGSDKDRTALSIAGRNLTGAGSVSHELEHVDSLMLEETNSYDRIFTNPPWGAYFTADEIKNLRKLYNEAPTDDSLGFFILKGLRSLKPLGIMSYVLPESFLYSKRFAPLRKYILNTYSVIKIKSYGNAFRKVFAGVVRIDIQKKQHKNNTAEIVLPEKAYRCPQNYFLSEYSSMMNIFMLPEERDLINRIYSKPHITLKERSEWSLGIVTGNNKKFINSRQNENFTQKVISGRNVQPFIITGDLKFLYNDNSVFHQRPKKDIFSSREKLVYRFVNQNLVFALDRSGTVTINSANVLIPDLEGYSILSVMAILNSKIMNFIYKKKFRSLKVLRSYLEELPFPKDPDKLIIHLIEDKTNRIINDNAVKAGHIRTEIDGLVEELYGVKI